MLQKDPRLSGPVHGDIVAEEESNAGDQEAVEKLEHLFRGWHACQHFGGPMASLTLLPSLGSIKPRSFTRLLLARTSRRKAQQPPRLDVNSVTMVSTIVFRHSAGMLAAKREN